MKIINHTQGTAPWFRWRDGSLGASDIAAVIGVSPYVTRAELLREKCRVEDREENFAMRRGRRLEPEARDWYEKIFKVAANPVCVQHERETWITASLDGLTEAGTILEIKCPKAQDHDFALCGVVPDHYMPQCQWQLLATGGTLLHYWSFNPSEPFPATMAYALVEVRPDQDYQHYLMIEGARFWAEVLAERAAMEGLPVQTMAAWAEREHTASPAR